jgi:hypothetical protein
MRRRSAGVLAGLLILVPALAAFGSTQTRYIKDSFDAASYSGSNGDLPWAGPWTEGGDKDPLEEGSGPSGGQIHVGPEDCAVAAKCAHFEGLGQTIEGASLKRFADLSSHVYADTCFYVSNVIASGGSLEVFLTADGGGSWSKVHGFNLGTAFTCHDAIVIPEEYHTEGFGIMLVVSAGEESVLTIDDVEIKGTVEVETTTTTTVASTTTTKRATTTTKATTTTTTEPETTTTTREFTTTTRPATTTTIVTSTTTRDQLVPLVSGTVPPDSGIRDTERGLLARYDSRSFGGGGPGIEDIEVLGVEVTADFSIAAEAFGAAKTGIAVLALIMGAAVVSGMDWRRTRNIPG